MTDPELHKGHPAPVVTPELQAQADAFAEAIDAAQEQRRAVELVDPVGLVEIAVRLRVHPQTPRNWRAQGVLPEPRWSVSGSPVWDWALDVEPWALETGRLDGGTKS